MKALGNPKIGDDSANLRAIRGTLFQSSPSVYA
jgi:hypothetical protein